MRRRTLPVLTVLVLLPAALLWSWGYRFHKSADRHAMTLLPEPLRAFYAQHTDEVVARSIDPDLWSGAKTYPRYTHYIDLDLLDNAPFARIPKTWEEAVATYGEARLKKAGTLPWEIARRKEELTEAFREKRWDDVVQQSAWISHYLADATMPLHTTKDYLGREAGNIVLDERGPNRSVHHRLEWGLIETFPERYGSIKGGAENVAYIDDVLAESWRTIHASYALIPPVLSADREAAALDNTFGQAYYDAFDGRMYPLVARQMKRSQELIASVWLTAWEDAGRPEPPRARRWITVPVVTVLVLAVAWVLWRLGHARRKR